MLISASCCAAALPPRVEAAEAPPALTRLYSRLRPVFERRYPEVRSQQEKDSIEFAQDTRTFLIHTRLKTGEWQEAREVKGPNRQGVLCSIELRRGKYNGAAVLPQTFDQRYFQTLVMSVPSPDEAAYFYVHLSYPDEVDPGFLKDFQETVQQAWAARPASAAPLPRPD
jgi:hypothetical protein